MPDWGSIADWVGAAAQVVAAAGTAWVIWQTRRTIEIADRSENTKVFLDFSDRYDAIKSRINRSFWKRFDNLQEAMILENNFDPPSFAAALELLDFFDKQHFIYSRGFVDEELWSKIWYPSMIKTVKEPIINSLIIYRKKYDTDERMSSRFIDFLAAQGIRVNEEEQAHEKD